MKTKLKQLTITRDKWARGKIKGPSMLLNESGNMCCLGFFCKALGFKNEEILNYDSPSFVGRKIYALTEEGYRGDTPFAEECMGINDDLSLSEKYRERELKKEFKKQGIKLIFK